MYREQRGHERIRRSSEMRAWPYLEGDSFLLEQEIPAKLIDVSKTGLKFESSTSLAAGRRINLKIQIENVSAISTFKSLFVADAVVRWSKELGGDLFLVGVELEKLSRQNEELWRTFIGRWRQTLL